MLTRNPIRYQWKVHVPGCRSLLEGVNEWKFYVDLVQKKRKMKITSHVSVEMKFCMESILDCCLAVKVSIIDSDRLALWESKIDKIRMSPIRAGRFKSDANWRFWSRICEINCSLCVFLNFLHILFWLYAAFLTFPTYAKASVFYWLWYVISVSARNRKMLSVDWAPHMAALKFNDKIHK